MNALPLEARLRPDLLAAAEGDRAAYGRVVQACQTTVTSLALAVVRDIHASEDIAQDAFIKAWRNLGQLRNPDSFLPWLRQVTRNLARDHLRAQAYRANPPGDIEALIAQVADPTPCPAGQHADAQEQAIAAGVIDALPEDSREVLLLYYREGQSSRQVAALLGLQDAAVRKRLQRARECVRSELLSRLGEFSRGSAPSAAFAGVVVAALTLGSPTVAAASVLGTAGAVSGKTFGKVLLGSAGGIAIGLLAAFAGIFWGLKRQLVGAIDDVERRALIRSSLVNAAATVAFMLAIVAASAWTRGWVAPVLATLAFTAVIYRESCIVQPRAMARRHAREAAADPTGAARRRRRERRHAWLGAITGLVLGGGGLVFGLIASGRL